MVRTALRALMVPSVVVCVLPSAPATLYLMSSQGLLPSVKVAVPIGHGLRIATAGRHERYEVDKPPREG